MKIYVKTYNEVKGLHRWKVAPASVGFLASKHRHVFHIITEFEVTDKDREIEIFTKEDEIEKYLNEIYEENGILNFGNMSCEMIASDILEKFNATRCEVLEDGKGGAIVVR